MSLVRHRQRRLPLRGDLVSTGMLEGSVDSGVQRKQRRATGYCLEIHDLVISKYVARDKDRRFVGAAARAGWVDQDTLRVRLANTILSNAKRTIADLIDLGFKV